MARILFCKPICAKEERNGPPSADQGPPTAEPRALVPPFLLVQNLSPKDIARSDITS